ncbi:hypothetical protein PENDEC_c002G03419 [Penicillium decumbens]|uniref:Uncharacterized protein n=1 Tax=Penicillium decumbens TaxID=69771 RepID=A0A1V6PM51_PENDC|nr:hypothetical protein PENDEC_c002G03419 [Penicillium decumbens]
MTEPDTASSPPSAEKTSTPPASRDNPITSNEPPSFHPDQITLATFKHLLSCYPQTVEQVHRRKITLKLQPKASKSAKRKANTNPTQQTQPDPSSEEHIRTETDKFIELDTWRYEHMPRILASRAHNNDVYLHKEELIRIMEWKL